VARVDSARPRRGASAEGKDALVADTPAQVVSIGVGEGDVVRHGDTLMVLEAMKMEFRLTAPHDGHVTAIHCRPGEVVERGKVLMEVERDC
jgi:3-methylcrotonyl-CoA carboxylase alpha subunit